MTPGPRVSELEGTNLKTKLSPAGTILTPRGRHLHCTCAIPGRIYPESLGSASSPSKKKLSSSCCFAKGSRGSTWLEPRDTWHHVTNAIVVSALWRIEWYRPRPDRPRRSPIRSYSRKSLDIQTDRQTNTIRPISISIATGANLRSKNGLRTFFYTTISDWVKMVSNKLV